MLHRSNNGARLSRLSVRFPVLQFGGGDFEALTEAFKFFIVTDGLTPSLVACIEKPVNGSRLGAN